ncbi:hypothetical protein J4E91_007059 [Alternaria rosae]|uniref:uncharacterized protein n=1 Tax=Alternaria rosae TaxID=1187941 RepID=UPI001E8CD131|nr:uncharacterized protein BKA58DRAFT_378594 [Alternaria rosae]KAH6879075.1 hypothetical protein BKA58DRAFT_378594 [Alternaria rosae]KAI4946887.1 hypothetical protein J4E91_007059 [Alternaria rosae]
MLVALVLAACAGAVNAASGMLEVDLVFPRNETYAATQIFPVIIAIQNPDLGRFLNPTLDVTVTNVETQASRDLFYDLRWANFSSSELYREVKILSNFTEEGVWALRLDVGWNSCTEDSLAFLGGGLAANRTSRSTFFTIKSSAPELDLVAATKNRDCTDNEAVAINVDATLAVPDFITWEDYDGKTCASMAATTPAPTPCNVKIDAVAASNISASMTSLHCQATRKPGDSCPTDEKSTAQRLIGGGTAGLVAAFGTFGYMMV